MFQKDMKISLLLDFYGELLTENKREALDLYYNEDLSLSEISAQMNISRQGARDSVKKGEALLLDFEDKLGLAKRFSDVGESLESLSAELRSIADKDGASEIGDELRDIADKLSKLSI